MTPDDFDPARGYDNPPACLRCDAKDQEIEALRFLVADLKASVADLLTAREREEWPEMGRDECLRRSARLLEVDQ